VRFEDNEVGTFAFMSMYLWLAFPGARFVSAILLNTPREDRISFTLLAQLGYQCAGALLFSAPPRGCLVLYLGT